MEYGLVLALTALFTVLILVVFGGTLSDLLIAIGQCMAVYWCGAKLCGLDPDHCELHSEVTTGRILCVVGLLAFSIIILYTRQLFARKPFDG